MHISVKENSFNALWYIRAERKPDVTDMLSHENRTTARVSFIHVFFFPADMSRSTTLWVV